MLESDQVMAEAKTKENENLRFRSYLKDHAEEETLDQQFIACIRNCFRIMIAANAGIAVKNVRG